MRANFKKNLKTHQIIVNEIEWWDVVELKDGAAKNRQSKDFSSFIRKMLFFSQHKIARKTEKEQRKEELFRA